MVKTNEITKILEKQDKIMKKYYYNIEKYNTRINKAYEKHNEILNKSNVFDNINNLNKQFEELKNSLNIIPPHTYNNISALNALNKEIEISRNMLSYYTSLNKSFEVSKIFNKYYSNLSHSLKIYGDIFHFLSNINYSTINKNYENRFRGEYSENFDLYIRKSNWILPRFATEEFIIDLKKNIDENLDIDTIFVNFFKQNNYRIINLMKTKWEEEKLIPKNIRNTIIKSITLFKLDEDIYHTFIIPVLIAQIDSLLNEILYKHNYEKEGNKFTKDTANHKKKNNINTFKEHVAPQIIDNWEEHHLKCLLEELFKSNFGKEYVDGEIMPFNRHNIMHGLCHDYDTIENTIRCYLIIDFLADFLSDEYSLLLN